MCSWIDYCYDAVNQQIGLLVISIRLLVKLCIICAKNVPWRPEVFLANNSQLDNFTARDHWAIGKDFEKSCQCRDKESADRQTILQRIHGFSCAILRGFVFGRSRFPSVKSSRCLASGRFQRAHGKNIGTTGTRTVESLQFSPCLFHNTHRGLNTLKMVNFLPIFLFMSSGS